MGRKRTKYDVQVNTASVMGITIKISPEPNNMQAIKEAIEKIDGVHFTGRQHEGSFTVYPANELFDEETLKQEIESCIQQLANGKSKKKPAPPQIKVQVQQDCISSSRWTIETDYQHTDLALLDKLTEKCGGPFEKAYLESGGYNFAIYTPKKSCGCKAWSEDKVLCQAKKVIDAFYAVAAEPPKEFKAQRTRKGESIDSFLVIATNYRFNKQQEEELRERFKTEVPGTYNGHFDDGGYNVHFIMANDFFDRDEAAQVVVDILKEYVAAIQC